LSVINDMSETSQYRKFCQDHEIKFNDVEAVINRVHAALPDSVIELDDRKYGNYGVLRLGFRQPDVSMLPMLFGTPANLSRLAQTLWKKSSESWSDEMEDLTQRGTYLKRRVLIPAILATVKDYYHSGDILDAGCGDGVLFKELLRTYDNVYGFDFVKTFIEHLSEQYPDIRERLSTADILQDKFDRNYEIVIASALLLTLSDVDLGLQRLFDLVKPGGTLIIADVCSRLHRSLGYYKGGELVRVHDPNRVAHFEKDVGGGQTTAIHNYHPPGYYRRKLEGLGAICHKDEELLASREAILTDPLIPDKDKNVVLQRMANDLVNPTFFLLVVSKKDF
jgi:2-polyprenyl-3-methyl-5-hydroxy-6-metoxy-1,4-benzoquinol methylase